MARPNGYETVEPWAGTLADLMPASATYEPQRSWAGTLGDAIMLLEGGPTGLEGAVLGDAMAAQAEDPASGMNVTERAKEIRDLISERRVASCKARTERQILTTRVGVYDKLLSQKLLPSLRVVIRQKNAMKADVIMAEIAKTEAARDMAVERAINFAKTEGLANVLTRNARTQLNTLSLAVAASQAGKPAAAKVLIAASKDVGGIATQLKKIRVKQIAAWTQKTAEKKNLFATAVAKQAQVKITLLQKMRPSAAVAKRLSVEKTRLAVAKKVVAATPRPISANKGVFATASAQRAPLTRDHRATPATTRDHRAAPQLDGLFDSITSAIKKVGSVVKNGAKTIGKAVAKVAVAAGKLIKKGACALAKNPTVQNALNAAVSKGQAAAGAKFGSKGEGVAKGVTGVARAIGNKLVSAACGGGGGAAAVNSMGAAADAPTTTAEATAPKKSFLPIVAAGGGAAALLFLLL